MSIAARRPQPPTCSARPMISWKLSTTIIVGQTKVARPDDRCGRRRLAHVFHGPFRHPSGTPSCVVSAEAAPG